MGTNLLYPFALIALAISWLIPNHYEPWLGFYNESTAVLGLLLLSAWLLLQDKEAAGIRDQLPISALLIFLVALTPPLQAATGLIRFWGDAWMASLFLLILGFSVFVGHRATHINRGRLTLSLAAIFLIAAMVSFFLALCQWLGIPLGIWLIDAMPGGAPYANIGQRNILATLFFFGLLGTLYIRERGILGNGTAILLVFLLIAGLAITRSRTPLLIIPLLAVWLIWNQNRFALKLRNIEVVAGTILFIALWLTWPNIASIINLYVEPSLDRIAGSTTGEVRLILWQQLIEAIWLKPFFGYGWNQVSLAQIEVATDYPTTVGAAFSHNLIIDLMLWNGPLLGSILALTGILWFLKRAIDCNSLESWFCLGILLILGVHGMVETPHTYAFFLVPAGLCIGIIEYSTQSASIRIPTWSFPTALVFGYAILGWVCIEYLAAEKDYRLMRFEQVMLAPKPDEPIVVKLTLLTQVREEILFRRTEPLPNMSDEKLQWMKKASHRKPSPENLSKLAIAQGLNGQLDNSANTLMVLEKLYGLRNLDHTKWRWISYACSHPELQGVRLPWSLDAHPFSHAFSSCFNAI